MGTAFNSPMIVTIIHPSVIDDDVQLDLHPRAEPQLLSSPRSFLQCWRTSPPGLAVVYSSGYGFRRPDGIAVVPVGALGPGGAWAPGGLV